MQISSQIITTNKPTPSHVSRQPCDDSGAIQSFMSASDVILYYQQNGSRAVQHPITLHKLHSSRPADSVSEKLFITCLLLLCVCGSVAEWLGCWTCNQQVAGSNPSLSAVECNSGQVVNTRASVTKQYNLVPANGQ